MTSVRRVGSVAEGVSALRSQGSDPLLLGSALSSSQVSVYKHLAQNSVVKDGKLFLQDQGPGGCQLSRWGQIRQKSSQRIPHKAAKGGREEEDDVYGLGLWGKPSRFPPQEQACPNYELQTKLARRRVSVQCQEDTCICDNMERSGHPATR